jgi:hypothetical protein
MPDANNKRSTVAPDHVQERVKKMIDDEGAVGAATTLGISRESAVRIAGGVPVRHGTLVVVLQKLGVKEGR